jgi:hypothetical protein
MTIQLSSHTDLAVVVGQLHRTDPSGNLFVIPVTAGADPAIIGTLRFAMPDPPSFAATVRIAVLAAEYLTAPGEWGEAAAVALAAYGPAPVADPLLGLLPQVILDVGGLPALEILRVHGGRCWSYLCSDEGHRRYGPGIPVDPWADATIARRKSLRRRTGGG